jgi:hypothetical protein
MSISPEEFESGRKAFKEEKSYATLSKTFLMSYLIPLCWLANSVVRYELRDNSWTRFQVIFWVIALVLTVVFIHRRKKSHVLSRATLEMLRRKYGDDVSFENEQA